MSGLDLRPRSAGAAEEPWRYKQNSAEEENESKTEVQSLLLTLLSNPVRFICLFHFDTELNLRTSLQEDQRPAGCCFPFGSPRAPDASPVGEKN